MSTFTPLTSESDLEAAIARSQSEPIVLYKHSTTCPISAGAKDRLQHLDKPDDPPVYEIVVQRSRALSSSVASHFDIQHESPQVIVLAEGEPIYHASHFSIRPGSIRAAIENIDAS